MVAQNLCKFLYRLLGWKLEALVPEIPKTVLLVAPHTSNWDFLLGKIGYTALGRKSNFVIKNDWMKGPLGWLMKELGGIGVDRTKAHRFTDLMTEEYKKREQFNLAITPEGTRKPNPRWKKGFYHIAVKAGVPITLVKMDYGTKTLSFFQLFEPTGDEQADIFAIQQLYRGVKGKNPENFVLPDKPLVK